MALEVKHVAIYRALSNSDSNAAWLQIVAATVPGTSPSGTMQTILAGTAPASNTQFTLPMFDAVRYVISAGSGYSGQTLITFQELGMDGAWRTMADPAPVNVVAQASTVETVNGVIDGPLLGVRLFLQGITGGNLNYVAFYGLIRSNL